MEIANEAIKRIPPMQSGEHAPPLKSKTYILAQEHQSEMSKDRGTIMIWIDSEDFSEIDCPIDYGVIKYINLWSKREMMEDRG